MLKPGGNTTTAKINWISWKRLAMAGLADVTKTDNFIHLMWKNCLFSRYEKNYESFLFSYSYTRRHQVLLYKPHIKLWLLLSVKKLGKFIFILVHILYSMYIYSYRYKIGKSHISFEHLFYNISVTNSWVKSPNVDVTFVQTQAGCYLPTLILTLCFLPLRQVVFCLCLLMSGTALAKGFVNVTKSRKFTV